MKITQVDDAGRLFFVEHVVPDSVTRKITSIDWKNQSCRKPNPPQSDWLRRILTVKHDFCDMVHSAIAESVAQLCEMSGLRHNSRASTEWWIDLPGFVVPTHTDGHLPAAMQVFWSAPGSQYGTVFYDHHLQILKHFEFRANTGYFMLNYKNDDGSQPLLWHGMHNPVPTDTVRVTTYTVFSD